MVDLDAAFYDRLSGDLELSMMLATYPDPNSASGSRPAVFTDEYVPEDAALPYIWTTGQVVDDSDEDKLQPGRRIMRDIGSYADRNETQLIEQIAQRVRELFHRHELQIAGAATIIADASGPIKAPTDETVVGRIVTVHLQYEVL